MSTKYSDEWGEFEIKVNDPKGQRWLYKDARRTLTIGWNHEKPSRGHIYTSEISPSQAGQKLTTEELAISIARFLGFMVKPGGGYSSVQLHLDADTKLSAPDLQTIDLYLAKFGLSRLLESHATAPAWERSNTLISRASGATH
jgi:hypothetical protein